MALPASADPREMNIGTVILSPQSGVGRVFARLEKNHLSFKREYPSNRDSTISMDDFRFAACAL